MIEFRRCFVLFHYLSLSLLTSSLLLLLHFFLRKNNYWSRYMNTIQRCLSHHIGINQKKNWNFIHKESTGWDGGGIQWKCTKPIVVFSTLHINLHEEDKSKIKIIFFSSLSLFVFTFWSPIDFVAIMPPPKRFFFVKFWIRDDFYVILNENTADTIFA